jgi:hypothetical protein
MKAAWVLLLSSGCVHWHFDRNAPGHIDVNAPPARLEPGKLEPPTDPGERYALIGVGPFGGILHRSGTGEGAIGAEAGSTCPLKNGAPPTRMRRTSSGDV